jgi:hydroxycarboxylate dehydrogenase B
VPKTNVSHLTRLATSIFVAYGVPDDQAQIVGEALAQANLAGHDSHGIIRVPEYIDWLKCGVLQPRAEITIVKDTDILTMVRGNHGFGQVIGRWAMDIAIRKARERGVALLGINHSGHLGRMGDYPAMAVREGLISLHFTNTHGGGKLVAPYGGSERRMSANPIAAGVPVVGGSPIIIDFSTSSIAGGKVHVAHNRGVKVPEGCLLDQFGEPTTEPSDFVSGKGALVHFGGHKGYALSFLCDVLAGALCDASCSSPATDRVANAMFTIIIDPGLFRDKDGFHREVNRYIEYLKSSALRPGFEGILYPGEPEMRISEKRSVEGIFIDDQTWNEVIAVAERYGVTIDE